MNDFSFMKKMSEEDAYLFKKCIRKMLDTTFIVADKDEKLYDFISSESNHYDVNTYLAAIGYKVVVEESLGLWNWCGSQSYQFGSIKIFKNLTPIAINRTMTLVDDDEVEEIMG